MNKNNHLKRITNQPLSKRLYQAVNSAIVPFFGQPLKVSHVLEYPKCGGSWVRNMLQTYLGGSMYFNDRLVSPNTVIHLHRMYRHWYSYPIVLFRDPRDVFVSFYFHEKMHQSNGRKMALHRYFRFIDSREPLEDFQAYLEVKLTRKTDPFFQYSDFIESWLHRKGVCCVTYEGFSKDAQNELAKVVRFLDEPVDRQKIDEAVEANNFENTTLRKYGVARKRGEENSNQFQRKGVVGDWVNYYNREARELLGAQYGTLLIELGYEVDMDWFQ